MKNNNALVIGGAGFLGSHLADALSDQGYQVTIFDKAPSLWLREDQTMLIGDIANYDDVDRAVKNANIVYHLAGIADIGESSEKPKETLTCNIVGSTNVIDACARNGIERFMFASTIYVYSDKGSFYRVSKQATELIIETYSRQLGLKYTILRYGSLYGPRAQPWNGLKRFVAQAVTEKRVVYPGTGEERREYIHVQDAARMSVKALGKEFEGECLTLTGAQILSSKEMVQMIAEISGQQLNVAFELPEGDEGNHHYTLTPYRYTPKQGKKLTPSIFIDIGQGILELIEEISKTASED